jgi:iron-sulfur cluster assembly protein
MITLTERAVKEIKHIMQDQQMSPETTYVRAGVRGGGCSGFTHLFTLDEIYDEIKDDLAEQDGLKIVTDKRSALYLEGTVVDFHDDLAKRGFSFGNPNSKGTCGCGSSFTV